MDASLTLTQDRHGNPVLTENVPCRSIPKRYYRKQKRLGRGSYGVVNKYGSYAIKVFFDDKECKYERKVARMLCSAYIVPVFDINETHALAMPMLRLLNTSDVIERFDTLVDTLLLAQKFFYEKGFAYTDIKPSNVFVDGPDRFVLGDLGSLRVVCSSNMVLGTTLLTPSVLRECVPVLGEFVLPHPTFHFFNNYTIDALKLIWLWADKHENLHDWSYLANPLPTLAWMQDRLITV